MPRYIVQRTFSAGLDIPLNTEGANICQAVGKANAALDVNWVHSYVQ